MRDFTLYYLFKFLLLVKSGCYITTALGWNVYDRVAHLETAHVVWLKLCNTYEGSSVIMSLRRDTYNRQYQTSSQKPGESLDEYFARFESIVSS
jgi:hypothetical protein